MPAPVTAITASTIATLAFQEFIKSGAGELAKKFATEAIAKMSNLRTKIVEKLKGKSAVVDTAIDQAAQGEPVAIETVGRFLDVAMLDYPEFAAEIRAIVEVILNQSRDSPSIDKMTV